MVNNISKFGMAGLGCVFGLTAQAASPAGAVADGLSSGLARATSDASANAGSTAAARSISGAAGDGLGGVSATSQRFDIPWGRMTDATPYQPPRTHITWDFNARTLPAPPPAGQSHGVALRQGLSVPGGSLAPSTASRTTPAMPPAAPPRASTLQQGGLSQKFSWAHEGPVPNGGFAGGVSRHRWYPPGSVLERHGSPDGRIVTRDLGATRGELGLPAKTRADETRLIELKTGQWSNDGTAARTYLSAGGKSQSAFSRSMKDLVESGQARYLPGKASK